MAARKKVRGKSVSRRGKIWVMAVDPFGDTDMKPTWNLVRPLAEHAGAKVHAVYVLAPASMNWTGEFSGPWMQRYRPLAEARLQEVMPGIDRDIVSCKESGLKEAVNALVRHAKKLKAECIVIATHARSGFERFAMGSFAETVILASKKIPVLIVNPDLKVPTTVRKILVPIDLSKGTEKYLRRVAEYARQQEAEIVLFHKQDEPVDPIIQQGVYSLGGGWVSMQSFVDSEREDREKRLEKLEQVLRDKKVPVSHIMDSGPDGLVESIDKAARDAGADMVSVHTEAGAWTATLLGSVARGLVRHSSVPVLVQR